MGDETGLYNYTKIIPVAGAPTPAPAPAALPRAPPSSALISHRLCPETGRWRGAASVLGVLLCMIVGPALPALAAAAAWRGHTALAAALVVFIAVLLTTGAHSPRLCAAYLRAAGWFDAVWMHLTPEALANMKKSPSVWCMHPHGTCVGFGFSLNGAVRFKAGDDTQYAPAPLLEAVDERRRQQCDGVMAPVLFRIPLLRQVLLGFGCATPATKKETLGLLARGIDFGILPGGMEEVALYEEGHDRIYIKKRAGFIKYALMHGFNLMPAYTFGESDLYRSLRHPLYRKLCHFTLSKGGFVVPCFWGPRWWCPLLPRDDVPLHTVIAEPVQLPLIPNPTNEDVAHWHAKYVAAVVAIYDGHKVRFGYGDRALEVF